MRRPSLLSFLSLALLISLAACNEGNSPAEPVSLPSVAGSWTGFWSVANAGVRTTMDLTQGINGSVTGTIAVLGAAQQINGTVTPTRFTWHLASPGCQTFEGALDLTVTAGTVTRMSGTATQDSRPCLANGSVTSGTLSLTRP